MSRVPKINWAQLLEKLLPAGSDDAARAALRADPEKQKLYIKSLEEVYGPLDQRMREMGFDADTWYHGGPSDLTHLRPSKDGSYGPGVYVTDSPGAAQQYADRAGGEVYDLKLKNQAPLNYDDVGGEHGLQHEMDMVGAEDLGSYLKDQGLSGIEAHGSDTVGKERTVLNPADIRSTKAAFDPRFKNSKDILAGTAGAAALGGTAFGSEESEAAGIQTIMKKLGVGFEEAKKLKQLATEIKPSGLHDENLRAIKDVSGLFKLEPGYKELGKGMDYIAHEAPSGRVVKEPKFSSGSSRFNGRTEEQKELEDIVSSPLMDSVGLGVNTKTVKIGDGDPYLVQDKVKPLSDISQEATRAGDKHLDELYRKLQAQEDADWQKLAESKNWPDKKQAIAYQRKYSAGSLEPSDELKQINNDIESYKKEIFKRNGIDSEQLQDLYYSLDKKAHGRLAYPDPDDGAPIGTGSDIPEDLENAATLLFTEDAQRKLGKAIDPFDMHAANIGVDANKKQVAFDTSRFRKFDPDAITPEQKQKIMESYIANPEAKAQLKAKIKAAFAGAGIMGAGAMGGEEAEAAPIEKVRRMAKLYAKLKGMPLEDVPEAKVKVERAKRIAQAYEDMKHDPTNPEVVEAYNAMINETVDQFKKMKEGGVKYTKITPDMENPYKSSDDLIKDIEENNHVWYYPTESGFGQNVLDDASKQHPLLKEIDVDGEKMPANDIFRIVHDYFGHGKEGLKFGPKGEENAWRQHKQMYSPLAQKAVTTETRGQNSWVNFGPHAEHNRANPKQTIYADQKAGLLPDWAYDTKALAAMAGAGAAAGSSGDAEAAPNFGKLVSKLKKVPYKVKDLDGELALESSVAKGGVDLRSMDTVESLDPEMVKHLESIEAENPAYIPYLEAEKGYGAKALKALEASAKKRGADSAYLNASPMGGTRGLSQEEAAQKLKTFYEKNGYKVAEDMGTNAMMYKKLAAMGIVGGAAAGMSDEAMAKELDPTGPIMGAYNKFNNLRKKLVGGAMDHIVDESTPPELQEKAKEYNSGTKFAAEMATDPLNLVDGPAGLAAPFLLGSDEEEEN